jgi:hypothetical protein
VLVDAALKLHVCGRPARYCCIQTVVPEALVARSPMQYDTPGVSPSTATVTSPLVVDAASVPPGILAREVPDTPELVHHCEVDSAYSTW